MVVKALLSARPAVLGSIVGLVAAALSLNPVSARAWYQANEVNPPWYAHAWYITSDYGGKFSNMGSADGRFDDSHCSGNNVYAMAFLDFGGPAQGGGPNYGGYGTLLLNANSTYEPDANVGGATESYILAWYNATSACPRLNIVIGTNNSSPCGKNATCASGAGANWHTVIDQVAGWVNAQGMAWQVSVLAGDDIEPAFSSFGAAQAFTNAFNGGNSQGYSLMNFGSADGCPPNYVAGCANNWSQYDVWQTAWQGADWPFPEMYWSGQPGYADMGNQWTEIKVLYGMTFAGVLSDCNSSDLIPAWGQPCYDINGVLVNDDTQAWQALWNDMNGRGVGQTGLDFLSNIRWDYAAGY